MAFDMPDISHSMQHKRYACDADTCDRCWTKRWLRSSSPPSKWGQLWPMGNSESLLGFINYNKIDISYAGRKARRYPNGKSVSQFS